MSSDEKASRDKITVNTLKSMENVPIEKLSDEKALETKIQILINGDDSGIFTITGKIGIEEIAVLASGMVDVLKEKLLKEEINI